MKGQIVLKFGSNRTARKKVGKKRVFSYRNKEETSGRNCSFCSAFSKNAACSHGQTAQPISTPFDTMTTRVKGQVVLKFGSDPPGGLDFSPTTFLS